MGFAVQVAVDAQGNKVRVIKARLVRRGFMDPQLDEVLKSSGTAKGLTHRLLCSKAVREGWRTISWDISIAFLQGISFEAWNRRSGSAMSKPAQPKRKVFFKMPTYPACTATLLYNLAPEEFTLLSQEFLDFIACKALKAIYALADAPAIWREALHRTFVDLYKAEQSVYDECLYFCRGAATKKVNLLLSLRIDGVEATGVPSELRRAKKVVKKHYGEVKEQLRRFFHCGKEYCMGL